MYCYYYYYFVVVGIGHCPCAYYHHTKKRREKVTAPMRDSNLQPLGPTFTALTALPHHIYCENQT